MWMFIIITTSLLKFSSSQISVNDQNFNRNYNHNTNELNSPLNEFLNSKTFEESQYALDKYLQSQNSQSTNTNPLNQNNNFNQANNPSQLISNSNSNLNGDKSQWTLQPKYQTISFKSYPIRNNFRMQMNKWRFMPNWGRQSLMKHSYWKDKSYGPINSNHHPVEIIYAKPPGHNVIPNNNFVNSPPGHSVYPSKPPLIPGNLYYSQLYSQSYDPYYYNYIAKTGKIKPWLYGKLGPHEASPSIWSELYHSFTKHGMRNMMNPLFLLGLTIPALTLMLTTVIQKRSFSQSNNIYTDYFNQTKLNEITERVSEAIRCYENNSIRNTVHCSKSYT